MKLARILGLFALLACVLATSDGSAFCGFYVGGGGAKLFNNATQVVLLRQGTRTVLSMQNNYKGPPEGFAMVVPVPVILKKENVRTLSKGIFERIDQLTSPRLVEYWEQDPCGGGGGYGMGVARPAAAPAMGAALSDSRAAELKVKVEAKFSVGEYDVVILSAEDAGGLETWLKEEKYTIPDGAEPYLRPYVMAGSKFFVAKVDPTKVKFEDGMAQLSPLRFHYDSTTFSLPVRLGLINSSGTQDIIINILGKQQRYAPANYPHVTIPTNIDLAEGSKPHFGRFYAALFDKTIEKNPGAIVTEYAWDANSCDPCPGPVQGVSAEDFATLGGDLVWGEGPMSSRVTVDAFGETEAGVRTERTSWASRAKPQLEQHLVNCHAQRLNEKPKLAGRIEVKATAQDGELTNIALSKNETKDEQLAGCAVGAVRSLSGLASKKTNQPVVFTMQFGLTPPIADPSEYVVTRLHARYTKDSAGQDIVFKAAPPIAGGRESRNEWGGLERGAVSSDINNFQARYAIRHGWKGGLTCKDPTWRQWGGPPNGNGEDFTAKPAPKTAFVARGGIDLVNFVRTDVKELELKAGKGPLGEVGPPDPAPSVTPAAPSASASAVASAAPSASTSPAADAGMAPAPTASGCKGCTTTGASSSSPLAVALALMTLVLRRRRS